MDKPIELLILDDEVNILSALKRMLMDEPFGVMTTTSPEDALFALTHENIKVILSDQRMPGMSGIEFFTRAKDLKPDTVRILFTGFADIKTSEEAINRGEVYRFVNKPWSDDELKSVIRESIRHYDLVRENADLLRTLAEQNESLKDLNKKLERMYQLQRDFTSTVSHELRTPLAAIKMAIDLILKKIGGEVTDVQKKYLNMARSNVDRLGRLVNDVLDLTKLESGTAELPMQMGDVNGILLEVSELYQPLAEEKGLYFKAYLDKGLPLVPLSMDKINQLLSNLVSNAVKFTEKGGVSVSTGFDAAEKMIRICVSDTGPGIAREDMPKMFRKFQQLGEAVMRSSGGTGLGLAICKEIVKQHRGNIRVESEPGRGSSFFVTLPVTQKTEGR